MIDLRYQMIMALSAADFGSPVCEQAAAICAEIAEQHCAQLHITMTAPVIAAEGVMTHGRFKIAYRCVVVASSPPESRLRWGSRTRQEGCPPPA